MAESEHKLMETGLLPEAPRSSRWLRGALVYTLAAVCLYWVLRDLDLRELLRRVAAMDPFWVAAATLFNVLSYVCQGLRWKLLLHPVGKTTVFRTTQAIYAGLLVNEMLPLKLGEIVRAFLIARWTAIELRSVVPSILLERLFDGVWLAVAILLTILFVPLPHKFVEAGDVFGFVIFVVLVVVILLARGRPAPYKSTTKTRLTALVQSVSFELRIAIKSRRALLAFLLSLLLMLLQAFSFWFVMRAYGLHLTLATGIAVFIIVHLGTLVPTTPANVGSYQFFTVLGLTLFGVKKATAAGFSLVVFTVLTAPLWVIGLWAVGSSGLSLFELRSELTRLFSAAKTARVATLVK